MAKPLSAWTKARIVELAAEGIPTSAIAQRLGISSGIVSHYSPKERSKAVYKLRSPTGEIYETDNLPSFCKEHNLHASPLHGVIRKERKHHKGWTSLT